MASEEIHFKIDAEVIGRVRSRYPDLDIRNFLKRQLRDLIGVKVKCSKCGYSWPYTGTSKRIKCNRCHHNVRVRQLPDTSRE